ncbi:hypothetical protein B0H15DRAFT_793254 [Mycena belliarum]|uniref:FIST domain-containing protein n=1 Tax=Mycena belliarum TaxID=1033014 RepID=A0AAD6TSE2_9AGAR|nr:hypothetical protein B0H15DRAFT_793254 [Mycena belliae]
MHFSTVLARSPAGLLSYISGFSKRYQDHVLLFALSPNVASSDLALLVQKLTRFSSRTIGCLSAPLPANSDGLISCSFAIFEPETCIPFRSQIPGRVFPQVGRWHSFRQKGPQSKILEEDVPSGNVDWGSVWDQSLTSNALPPELENLRPDDIGTIIYLSDPAPEGLSNTLARFPGASKLGLFAASTPFITGRPVTLFQGENIYDSGAVGLALRNPKARAGVQFLGMKPISPPMVVTQAEGNLIVSLDKKNPTKLLLAAIQNAGLESNGPDTLKDNDEFSLATMSAGEPHQMCNIMSGDPSRGTMALRSMSAPPIGAQVQFFHRPKSTTPTIPEGFTHSSDSRHILGFLACTETRQYTHASATEEVSGGIAHIFHNVFLAGSEGGFISSRSQDGSSEAPWSCTIPGGLASLSWPIEP